MASKDVPAIKLLMLGDSGNQMHPMDDGLHLKRMLFVCCWLFGRKVWANRALWRAIRMIHSLLIWLLPLGKMTAIPSSPWWKRCKRCVAMLINRVDLYVLLVPFILDCVRIDMIDGCYSKVKEVTIDGKRISLRIWDTAGQEVHQSIIAADVLDHHDSVNIAI